MIILDTNLIIMRPGEKYRLSSMMTVLSRFLMMIIHQDLLNYILFNHFIQPVMCIHHPIFHTSGNHAIPVRL